MTSPQPPTPLELHAAGRLVGSYRWVEKQLFHLLGAWMPLVKEPAVKMFLDEQSLEHAWHANLWAERLPDLGAAGAGLTVPANSGIASAFKHFASMDDRESTIEKLTSIYRVLLPRIVTNYAGHLDRALTAGNDPTQRALRLILANENAAWRTGEMLLQSYLVDADAVDRAIEQQRLVERDLVEAGGLAVLTG